MKDNENKNTLYMYYRSTINYINVPQQNISQASLIISNHAQMKLNGMSLLAYFMHSVQVKLDIASDHAQTMPRQKTSEVVHVQSIVNYIIHKT